jgi:hypothetical protein
VIDPSTMPEWQQGCVSGKLLVPLVVRRQAASEMPESMRRLKQQLDKT